MKMAKDLKPGDEFRLHAWFRIVGVEPTVTKGRVKLRLELLNTNSLESVGANVVELECSHNRHFNVPDEEFAEATASRQMFQ